MSETKYICTRAWRRHSLGTIITEWEYNKLPQEIKDSNSFIKHFPVFQTAQPVKDEPTQVQSNRPIEPAKVENDIRPVKRYNFPQDPVEKTDGN